nr:hypothetical protein [Macrococcus goetzii]
MDINSIKTKVKQHKHITLKQKDNTSPIELILCGADGKPLTSLSGACTISLLDLNDKVVRSKINGQVNAGVVSFVVTDHLKANKHSIEIDVGGRKFPSDGDFIVQVSMSHEQVELNIISNITKETALQEVSQKVLDYITSHPEEYRGKSAYELAVKNGFTGTEAEWLNSLKARIEENSIGLVHTRFKKTSSNIAELADLVNNTYLDGTKGTESTSTVYKTSDFVSVTPGDLILLAYVRSYAFYDANKVYISGAANNYYLQPYVSPHTEVPSNAAYIKYSVQQDNYNQFALIKNDYMYSDKRKYVVDKRYIEEILLTDIKGLIPSKNLFDKTKVEINRLIKADLTIAGGSGYNVSRLMPLEVGQPYTFTKVHSVIYYNDKFIAQKYTANPTTITENYPYIRVNVTTANLDTAQIEKGTVATPYVPFTEKKIPAELLPSNLGGGTAYDQSLNQSDNVIFNKVTAKVIEADSIISPATLPKGTLASPPSGLVSGDMWADTTDSATHPILRVMM